MIISASRRTDIPAFYSEWFMNRIKEGFLIVRNPMNNQPLRLLLSPDIVDCIVFWTKNPIPMLPRLEELEEYCYYFQFTLTAYGKDVEPNLPDKQKELIPAFQSLAEKLGPERVIWRYDPILINERYTKEYHLQAFEEIASALKGYTKKCVFSFVDIYAKNKLTMQKLGVRELTHEEMRNLAMEIKDIADKNGMALATCAENIDLQLLGILHNACIDKALIEQLTGGKIKDTKKNRKDAGQRAVCNCMISKEIGTHNTCGNGCVYCYANHNAESVKKSMEKYNPRSPILCDSIKPHENVKDATDMKRMVVRDGQLSLFLE